MKTLKTNEMKTDTNNTAGSDCSGATCYASADTPIIIMTCGGKSTYRSHPDLDQRTEAEKIRDYQALCVKGYGKNPTDYQKGILQGLDCALSFVQHNTRAQAVPCESQPTNPDQ